ncbi:MAG TPA: hypothetical protein VJG64_03420 [Candidatus Paceibacterota bacterium]
MTLISKHPYSFLFAGAGIVLIAMILLVRNQNIPMATNVESISFSSGNTVVNPGIVGGNPLTNPPLPTPIEQGSTGSAPYVAIPIGQTNASEGTTLPINTNPLASLLGTNVSAPTVPTESDQLLNYVYSLVPSGITTTPAPKARSVTQQALYTYGNAAGSIVLAFTNAHTDMAEVLKAWLADRANTSKVASAQSIARDMQTAGQSLAALRDVPNSAAAANQALAKAYEDAGKELLAVIAAGGSDSLLVEAMKTYDVAADSYTSSYVALVEVFSIYGVTFSASDPGSAFQFSPL